MAIELWVTGIKNRFWSVVVLWLLVGVHTVELVSLDYLSIWFDLFNRSDGISVEGVALIVLSIGIVGERVSDNVDWDFTLVSDWHVVFDVWLSFLRDWTESLGVW